VKTAKCIALLAAAVLAVVSCESGGKSPTGPGPITSLALEFVFFQDPAANPGDRGFDWFYQYPGIADTGLRLSAVSENARGNYPVPAGCSANSIPWVASITLPALSPTEFYWNRISRGNPGPAVLKPCATVRGPKNSVSVTPSRDFASGGSFKIYQNNGTLVLG